MKFTEWFMNVMSVPVEDEAQEIGEQVVEEQTQEAEPIIRIKRPAPREQAQANIRPLSNMKVVLAKPVNFEEGPAVADHVNQKCTVVLNLEGVNKDVCRRIIDFLTGVAYANEGTLKRVANSTYLITPKAVDLMGDMILDELESSGLYLDV